MQRLLIQNYRYDQTPSKRLPSGHDGSALESVPSEMASE
jgi:hypothetical protein